MRKRIALTLRLDDEVGPRTVRDGPPQRNNGGGPPIRRSEPLHPILDRAARGDAAQDKRPD